MEPAENGGATTVRLAGDAEGGYTSRVIAVAGPAVADRTPQREALL